MKLNVFLAFALVLCFRQEIAHAQCAELFSSSRAQVATDPTDLLLSYLTQLLENNAIGERELVTLREGANPIPHKQTEYGSVFETSARRIQYQVVEAHLLSGRLDHTRLTDWAKQKLEEQSRVRESREEVRQETQSTHRKMEFHRLPPGEFRMGEPGHKVSAVLAQPFEMMASPITQNMWVELMGENPSHFKDGPQSVVVEINGKMVRMQPDHPVENVTWWSVVVFANRLSEKYGLKPVYDLSEVETKGRAEVGTLEVIKGDFKIIAPDEDIYQAEGFRLPTVAEQEYVLRNLGRAKGEFPHDLDAAELKDYAWFQDNSDFLTHEVGTTRKSLVIDGKQFDDLIGNVAEWGHDYRYEKNGFTSHAGAKDTEYRSRRGGSFLSSIAALRSGAKVFSRPQEIFYYLGARLVRTVK